MKLVRMVVGALLLGILTSGSLRAETTLKVGIKPSEPWVMYDASLPPEQRQPKGFSIDLWNGIAHELGVKTAWTYFDTLPDLIKATGEGKVDAGISAITVTREREKRVNFSDSMYELGLQIMVPVDTAPNPWLVALEQIGNLFTWEVWLIIAGLVVVFAHLRWLVDRRSGDGEASFPADYRHGIGWAMWWAMTMFLSWDTPPRRGVARAVDLIWFLMGFLCLGILSSVITAALTAQNIASNIQGVQDLLGKRVAAVATDNPKDYLQGLGLDVVPVKDLAEGVQKVANKEVDALVHDGPRLVYLANQHNKTADKPSQVLVLPASFNPQFYGIAFPVHSTWIEPVNQALLKLREAQGMTGSVYESLRKKWVPN